MSPLWFAQIMEIIISWFEYGTHALKQINIVGDVDALTILITLFGMSLALFVITQVFGFNEVKPDKTNIRKGWKK